jgi:hypothetical protein
MFWLEATMDRINKDSPAYGSSRGRGILLSSVFHFLRKVA